MFRDLKRVPCFRGRSANEESLQDRRESMRVLQDQHAFAMTYAGRWFCKSVAKAWHPAHDLSIRCLNRKRNGKQKLPKSRGLREFAYAKPQARILLDHSSSVTGSRSSRMYMGRPLPL